MVIQIIFYGIYICILLEVKYIYLSMECSRIGSVVKSISALTCAWSCFLFLSFFFLLFHFFFFFCSIFGKERLLPWSMCYSLCNCRYICRIELHVIVDIFFSKRKVLYRTDGTHKTHTHMCTHSYTLIQPHTYVYTHIYPLNLGFLDINEVFSNSI